VADSGSESRLFKTYLWDRFKICCQHSDDRLPRKRVLGKRELHFPLKLCGCVGKPGCILPALPEARKLKFEPFLLTVVNFSAI
jgi:hypothetical protein